MQHIRAGQPCVCIVTLNQVTAPGGGIVGNRQTNKQTNRSPTPGLSSPSVHLTGGCQPEERLTVELIREQNAFQTHEMN